MTFVFVLVSVLDYSIGIKANLAYDDNIFSYSRRYLDEYMQGLYPERFPFETYDDLFSCQEFEIFFRKKIFMSRTTTFHVSMKTTSYFNNRQKDYQVLTGSIRQSFGDFAAKFEYLLIPNFLIKYYREIGGTSYTACEFTEHLYTLKGTFTPGDNFIVSVVLAKETDDYVEAFDVYDSKANRAGAGLSAVIGNIFEPAVDYEIKDSDARGPVPDISYVQHHVQLRGLLRLRVPRLTKVWLGYGMKYRIYTTDVSPLEDSPHSGRQDINHSASSGLSFSLFTKLAWSIEYAYEISNSFSESYPDIAQYKDYNKWSLTTGLRFEY